MLAEVETWVVGKSEKQRGSEKKSVGERLRHRHMETRRELSKRE